MRESHSLETAFNYKLEVAKISYISEAGSHSFEISMTLSSPLARSITFNAKSAGRAFTCASAMTTAFAYIDIKASGIPSFKTTDK
jgi:hypothetical protein